jgi:hypothetical protein
MSYHQHLFKSLAKTGLAGIIVLALIALGCGFFPILPRPLRPILALLFSADLRDVHSAF